MISPLFALEQISVSYPLFFWGQRITILQNINFSLFQGESVGIFGESGIGKTTLAFVICGLLPPDQGYFWWKKNRLSWGEWSKRRTWFRAAQPVFQDPFTVFDPKYLLKSSFSEMIRLHHLEKEDSFFHSLLERLSLSPSHLQRYPHQLSGGELQRLQLARILLLRPQLLVLDEPTSALDDMNKQGLMNLLRELQREFHLTLLFFSHETKLLEQYCTRVLCLSKENLI